MYCVSILRKPYLAFGTGCVLRIAYCVLRILVHCLPAAMGVSSHKRPVIRSTQCKYHPKYGGRWNAQHALRSVRSVGVKALFPKMMVLYNTLNAPRIRRLLNTLRKPYSR